MKQYKVLVWADVRTNDHRDGFGDYQNQQLIWNGMMVFGRSEAEVRLGYQLSDGVVLQEVSSN